MGALTRGYAPSDLLGEHAWIDRFRQLQIEAGAERGSGDRAVDRRRFLLTSLAVFSAWRTLNLPRTFKNQGDSVSFVNTAM
jgi:hypothetical protein